jgi:hypothetical protein
MNSITLAEVRAGDERLIVNTEVLAWCLNLSERRIAQLAEEGILLRAFSPSGDYAPAANWNLAEVVHDYLEYKISRRGWRQMR